MDSIFTYKITDAKKEYVQADNTDRIHVAIEILKGDDPVEERSFGYPLETSNDKINADLDTFIATYNADYLRNIENAAHEAKQAAADQTIQALKSNQSTI